ncbi:hypothetical protein GF359_02040 [candidate division WOR-3 bacterium]|uniref:Uncharacterized protein n=1 Tax=candidate division WOR-3 bacterium TaxID=2052148 RepID=A0A9D5QDE8_UNCW3|nr:hypothetical protein [candidate division WOR-3 bacterium]MBD3363975.1 hypothetical protein [candidate division WOR-3 bacterium]
MAIKRYYRFGEEERECWENCPTLQKLLNPRWLDTQSQQSLLWNTHPLFFDICLNPPAVYALEKALKTVTEDTRNVIKKYIKKDIGRDKDKNRFRRGGWYGFLSEIFVLLRLYEKGLGFDYRPGMPGADFIIPALNNLKIEVTSLQ